MFSLCFVSPPLICVLQLPIIWEIFLDDAAEDYDNEIGLFNKNYTQYQADLAAWEVRQQTKPSKAISQGRGKKKKQTDPKPTPPKKPHCRMHPDEPEMLLRLSTSLKLFMGSSVDQRAITRAFELLVEYLNDFKKVLIFPHIYVLRLTYTDRYTVSTP
jgi:hypothetical protein